MGVDPAWLAIRRPFDEAALDRGVIASLQAWGDRSHGERPLHVVDLGSGTGVALRRAARWLSRRPIHAFAVDADPSMLAAARAAWADEPGAVVDDGNSEAQRQPVEARRASLAPYQVTLNGRPIAVVPVLADALGPLAEAGGPDDGSVHLVLGHALADLVPLDVLTTRAAALLRTGGLAHFALTYDGETRFDPVDDPALEARVMAAFLRHMDRPRATTPSYGGSTAGERLATALEQAGLQVVRAGPSDWIVRQGGEDGPETHAFLTRMVGFVEGSLLELGEPPEADVRRWAAERRARLDAGRLGLWVRHRDLLARRVADRSRR